MDTNNRTLRDVITDNTDVSNLNSYYTIFGIQLFFRFADTTNLDVIDTDDVREVARFSLACARVANDVWSESWETERKRIGGRRERETRETRAA